MVWLSVLGLAVGVGRGVLFAQEQPAYTLHAYADLIQIPVLVLGPDREPTRPIAPDRFRISLDDGPKFQATHVRREADDPITLAIVLDVRGWGAELMPKIDDAIAELAPLSLRPQDHVSIYALDCALYRSTTDKVPEREELKQGVDLALQSWNDRKKLGHRRGCKQSIHLWDTLAFVTREMYGLPGRRVILAVTDGSDGGSLNSWNRVRLDAQVSGVAIFGLTYLPEAPGAFHGLGITSENAFNSICELSGGMVLTASRRTKGEVLKRFVALLRNRYIVEFPRPLNSEGGAHSLMVTIDHSDAFIRASGISVPIPDPAVMDNPLTVPEDPSRAPKFGKRRIFDPQ